MGRRFVVSRLSSLGDVVCSLPAAMALKAAEPDSHVAWIVDPRFADVVRCCSGVDETVCAKPGWRWSSLPSLEGEFDAALDLQGLLKSAAATFRIKAKRRVGYHWQREGSNLFSSRVMPDPTSRHIVDQYVDVARSVGGVADQAQFGLAPTPESLESLRGKLPTDRFVAINPGAGWATKRWPVEHVVATADRLAAAGIACVLIGGPSQDETDAAAEIVGKCANPPTSMVGQTSVGELIALLSLAGAHLGGDTGSTHLAAALGIPAVALYATTNPQRSCPYGQIDRCFRDERGLSFIAPEAVADKLIEAAA